MSDFFADAVEETFPHLVFSAVLNDGTSKIIDSGTFRTVREAANFSAKSEAKSKALSEFLDPSTPPKCS